MVNTRPKRQSQTLLVALAILALLCTTSQVTARQDTYYFVIGATGDDSSRGNIGVQAEIRTNSYYSSPYFSDDGKTVSSDSFALAEPFTDGSTIYFGYAIYSQDVYWFWQRVNVAGTEDGDAGFAGSVGPNGTWHTYSIEYDPVMTYKDKAWDLILDGARIRVTQQTQAESNATAQAPFFFAEKITHTLTGQVLGPVQFRNLSYLTPNGWQQVKSLKATTYCLINRDPARPCGTDIPYGVAELGPNHIIAGSGIQKHAHGEILWTTNPIDYLTRYLAPIAIIAGLIVLAIFGIRRVPIIRPNWKPTIN